MPQTTRPDLIEAMNIALMQAEPFPIWLVRTASNELIWDMLSEAERQRAARFHNSRLRDRYATGHAALRQLVAASNGVPPSAQRYGRLSDGKPYLMMDPDLSFSLSYSGDRLLIAIDRGGAIGVDLEQARQIDDRDELAEMYFTDRERKWLAEDACNDAHRFLQIWTRKEACVKAVGVGLQMPLRLIECHMEMRVAPVCVDPHFLHVGRIHGLDGYIAAWARISEPFASARDRQWYAQGFRR
jgi:4'-phosphopantetheinyl transferase